MTLGEFFSVVDTYKETATKSLSCLIYSDASVTHLQSLCIDISTAINSPPAVSSIAFSPLGTASASGLSCLISTTSNTTIICDVILRSPKIYELKLNIKDDNTGTVIDSQVEYEQYADSISRQIQSSSEYFATLATSQTDNSLRVHVHKRKSANGGTLVYYSENLQSLIGTDGYNYNHFFSLYKKIGDKNTKLMIQDRSTQQFAKVFNITDLEIETKSIGYYEQSRLQNVSLVLNNNLQVSTKDSLYSMYFNPGTAEKNVSDLESTNYLTKYLWLWITLGSIILIAAVIVLCYYCRRETIDKYSISL